MTTQASASRSLAAALLGAAVCAHAGVALAQGNPADVKMINVGTTSIFVRSDNISYVGIHRGRHPLGIQLSTRVEASAPKQHRINSWKTALVLQRGGASYAPDLEGNVNSNSGVYGESYASKPKNKRPRQVDKEVLLTISSSHLDHFASQVCNVHADQLRQQGLSNQEIFEEDRIVKVSFSARAHSVIVYSPTVGSNFIGPEKSSEDLDLVCMKGPAPAVDAAGSLQSPASVSDVSLTVLEQSTLGGACKVNLSTVIRTNQPNTEVRYRFEHTNGAQSDIKKVTTSHSSTAMDAHWYDVPLNPQGAEAGSVRVVGVSHDFQSAWKTYSMTCVEQATGALSTPTIPSVQLDLQPIDNVMHQGMICPTRIRIKATLLSQMAFSGTGVVSLKSGNYAFATHSVNLAPGVAWPYVEEMNLRPWNTINAPVGQAGGSNTWQVGPGASTAAPSQRFEIRYNLSSNQQSVVATPFKTIAVSCTDPKVNAGIRPATDLTLNRPDRPQQVRPGQLQLGQQQTPGRPQPVKPGQLQLGQQQAPDRPLPVKPGSPKPQQQVMTAKPPKPAPRTTPVKPAGNQLQQGQSVGGPQMRAQAQPEAADRDCQYDPNSAVLPCLDGRKRMKLINPFE